MNFNTKQIYVADLNQAKNYKGKDTDYEFATFDSELILKDCVVIKAAEDIYVPYFYFKNLLSKLYLKILFRLGKHEQSDMFVSSRPGIETKGLYFISNVRKIPLTQDTISKTELNSLQYNYDQKNNTVDNIYDNLFSDNITD